MGVATPPFHCTGGTQQVSEQSIVGKAGEFNICFRDVTLSNHAGLVLLRDFADRLGVAELLDEELHVKQRERGHRESEAVLSLSHNLIAGGQCLLDLNVLRGDVGTQQVLGLPGILAPSTAGDFLRKFDIGDIHDLNRFHRRLQERIRPQQRLACCTLDVDSSIYEQVSTRKQGSTKAYNGQIGYHPFLVFWYEADELVFSHLRRGNAHTSKKAEWCLTESFKRLPAEATKKLRADSGLYDHKIVAWCEKRQVTFGITADQTAPVKKILAAIPEQDWHDLLRYDAAQVSEFRYQPQRWSRPYRYVAKRELRQDKHGTLYFHYHVFVTNDEATPMKDLLTWQLQHADMENLIKEHKHGFDLEKLPTRSFHANWAYLLIGQLAFNLVAWFKKLILPTNYHRATLKTIRHHLFNVAGKIVHTARQFFLVMSSEYCYQDVWQFALSQLAQFKCVSPYP
jgi:hypothetical protein